MKQALLKQLAAAALGLALTAPGLSRAAWPDDKPITLIVPWAAGGSTDILARVLSEGLTQSLKQSVIVENRSGASGNIGSTYVARAKPDGYTLLVGSMSTHTMNQALYANMPFDGVKDFTPIAELALVTNTMVTHPSVPANNVREFIDYLKANPDKVAYASAGQGSTNHLSAALFEKAAGVKMVHVPYRGGAPAVLDTVAGRTQVLFSAGTQTLPHVQSGKLKLLAVTEEQRSPLLPGTPTVAETLPGYELSVWYGAFGPGPAGRPHDPAQQGNQPDPETARRRQEDGGHGRAAAGHHARAVRQDADARCRQIRQADQGTGSDGRMSALLPLPAAGQDELRRIEQAYADADPLAALAAINAYAGAALAHALFTVNRHDAARMRVVRLYSSNPSAYPPGGGKDKAGTAWGRHVLLEHKVFVGEGEDAIQAFFDDHAAIQALGLRSVINVPVVLDGACLGTLNFLMPRPAVSASNLHTARLLGLVALPALQALCARA